MADTWWSIQPTDTNAWRLDMTMEGSGTSRRILLLSDIHWDNAHCELGLLRETLEQAKAENCPIFSFGDLFCAMQGKWDPRASRGRIHQQTQLFLRCSAWKDESNSGWHVEKGRAARPIGGWWLELTTVKKHNLRSNTYSVTMRALPT